jgi:hypothetical protein
MEEVEDISLKEFRLVLITLACQTWTLSRLFQRVPLAPSKLQETLDLFEARLKKISNFLLIEWSGLGSDNGPHTWPESAATLQYSLASTALAEIFHFFTPVYALCFALNDYNGTGGTDRQADPCFWVAGYHKVLAILPNDETIHENFLSVASECESRTLDIISCFDTSVESILASYPDL